MNEDVERDAPRSLVRFWRKVLRRVLPAWRPWLAAHLFWTGLGVVALAPALGALVRVLVGWSGAAVLADQDLAWFVLRPTGLVALTAIAAAVLALASLSFASALHVLLRGDRQPGAARAAVRFTMREAPRILSLSFRLAGRVIAMALPFLAAGAGVAAALLTEHDINYYLARKPPAFWYAAAAVGVIAIAGAAWVVGRLAAWCLALPLVLFERVTPRSAFATSAEAMGGHRRSALVLLLSWAMLAFAVSALAGGAMNLLGEALLTVLAVDTLSGMAALLGSLALLGGAVATAVAAFNGAVLAGGLLRFGRRAGRPWDAAPSAVAKGAPRRPIATPAVLATLATAAALGVGLWLANGTAPADDAIVIAHRGAAGKAPENTLASVRQAIGDGADRVEIDVQETVAGEIVVVHDSDFMKLADEPMKVWEGRLEDIRRIDVGAWFAPEFAGERVPTLGEVLAEAKGKAGVVIELKYYGHDVRLEERVVAIVEAMDMVDEVSVMSLDAGGIAKVRTLRPGWRTGLLVARAVGDLTRVDTDFLAVNLAMAKPSFIRRAHAAGKAVYAWTVNDAVTMSRLLSLGVDGLITDEPELARAVLAERASMGPAERLALHAAALFGGTVPERSYRDDSP